MTIMTRLHAKGLLTRDRDGKTYVYRPAFSREEHRAKLSRDLVRGLVDEFGDVALAHGRERVAERHPRLLAAGRSAHRKAG